jgi:hypothetical protein
MVKTVVLDLTRESRNTRPPGPRFRALIQKVATAECDCTASEGRPCRALELHLHGLLRSSAKQRSQSFDLRDWVHSCSQYVTRPPLWHTKRTPPSREITTATDPGMAPHKR